MDETDIRRIFSEIQEIKVQVAQLPTREDLKQYATRDMIDATKDMINLKIDKIQEEIDELRDRPANRKSDYMFASAIVAMVINVLGFVLQHFVWR